MLTLLRPALVLFTTLTILCGLAYPYAITGIAHLVFPEQAAGSLVRLHGQAVGSLLIGQAFDSPRYFWGRPSATAPAPYDATASGGANLGPNNPAQIDAVRQRVQALRGADPTNTAPIPVDLVTTSASGLDPEISLAAAYFQAPRIARVRNMRLEDVRSLIDKTGVSRGIRILSEPRVNVLALNLALDQKP